jgi:lysozyme
MQASSACYDFIKKQEGFALSAYDDGGGVWTIGWGITRWDLKTPVKKGDSITESEAQRQLEIEVHRVEDAINKTVKVPLTQPEFDALVSLFYNIGTGWCTGEGHDQATLIKLLNQGKYAAVPAQFLRFERDIHGRVVEGLEKRRRWESQMWLSDDHTHVVAAAPQNEPGQMPQTVTPSKASTAAETAKNSWTIRAGAIGLFAWLAHALDSVFGVFADIAKAVVDTASGELGPMQTLGSLIIKNAESLTFAVTGLALVIVITRRLQAGVSGKVG